MTEPVRLNGKSIWIRIYWRFSRLADDKTKISRAFHNLEINYGDMNLTFVRQCTILNTRRYGRKRLSGFGAYALKIGKDSLTNCLQVMHDKIESLFERSITERLREIMR
jgi:hypothetical protein